MTQTRAIPKECPECGTKIKLVRQKSVRYPLQKKLGVLIVIVVGIVAMVFTGYVETTVLVNKGNFRRLMRTPAKDLFRR